MSTGTLTVDAASTFQFSGEIPRTKRVLVYNNGSKDYTEFFKDETITIPAHRSIEMTRSDAIDFAGRHPGKDPHTSNLIEKNILFGAIPESGSSLRAHNEHHVCHVCSQVFSSAKGLEDHVEEKHRNPANAPVSKRYACLKCDAEYIDKEKLIEHTKNAHPEKDQSQQQKR